MVSPRTARRLKFGVLGLGKAARMVLPAFKTSRHAVLAAGADPRDDARASFQQSYGVPSFASAEELLESEIDAVWIATPNPLHAHHAIMAAHAGKHMVCEKPMALSLEQCDSMIAAAAANKVKLLLGHSKLIQAPIRKMREVIDHGVLGRVTQLATLNFNDWLRRPRLAAELNTEQGGGVCYRQAPHQIDIVRYLAARPAQSVRAVANRADPDFGTEGNYSALITFTGGLAATLAFSGYGYFDITELTWGIGEGGEPIDRRGRALGQPYIDGPTAYRKRATPDTLSQTRQPFYGLTIVSCERGVLRQSPGGLFMYDENGRRELMSDPDESVERDFAELAAAIVEDRAPFPDGHWGKATLEICLGLLESSTRVLEVPLHYQAMCR